MKKLFNLTVLGFAAFAVTACTASTPTPASAIKVDEKALCNVSVNGIAKVLETAKVYNTVAQKEGVEFRRLGVNNSALIEATEAAVKSGAKEVTALDTKGKPSKEVLETNFAAERACKFAISALAQKEYGKTNYKLAIPGDGYKY